MPESLGEILEGLRTGRLTVSSVLSRLEEWELADEGRGTAFGITPENVGEVIRHRVKLFQSIYDQIDSSWALGINKNLSLQSRYFLEILWGFWLPLAVQLAAERKCLGRPLVQGILGGQGTGKTTLAKVLTLILGKLGQKTVSLSLDDLYKTYRERQQLREEDPRLIWRGPPATHDVELGIKVLDELRQGKDGELPELAKQKSIEIPRFDKSCWGGAGDRINPEIVEDADIVLFEGWFVGVRPIEVGFFEAAPPPIFTEEDREFARDMNGKLREYLPLWERCDRLMILYPSDYRFSKQWRLQAERDMMAAGKSGMGDEEINRFVEYFWKALHPELFIKPLVSDSEWVDLVVEINFDHSLGRVYRPGMRGE